jgi:Xaa-Pro aminopeptidase
MSELLGSNFFAGNRERLKNLFTGTAPIVLTAHGLLQKSADEFYPFRQDSSFWYLSGCNEHDIILVMDKDKEYLIVPSRDPIVEAFDGAIDTESLAAVSGIKDIVGEKEGWQRLGARLKKVQHVATLAANKPYIEHSGMYSNPARASLIARMKEANPELKLLDLRQHLSHMRMIKQPQEVEALRGAIDVTVDTLKEVSRPSRLTKYGYEYELEADITRGFRRRGAQGHAFSPIVASGERACTLHHIANDGQLSSDELVVVDVGAQYQNYCADITRTVSLGGQPSRRQQQVHMAVADVQDYAYSLLKPGVDLQSYEKQIEKFMGEKLRELGLIKSIDSDAVRQYFPHATSHFLGLDAHDSGDYGQPLSAGMVITVEPGIYVREESIGIRIEDDVLITENGIEILTSRLPREL